MAEARKRWAHIIEELADLGQVEVNDLAETLKVSRATVRRDLDQLAQQQILTRTRGGGISNSTSYDLPLRYNAQRNVPQKLRIAEAAAARISPGLVVAITGGTTTTEVARSLALRADKRATGDTPTFTVVTNALNIANELIVRPHLKLVVLGGVVRPQSYELTGDLAILALNEISIDHAIIGGNAIDLRNGLTCHNEGEAGVAKAVAKNAAHVTAVMDSTKLGNQAFARICAASEINTLVTDGGADGELVREFEEAGITVVIA